MRAMSKLRPHQPDNREGIQRRSLALSTRLLCVVHDLPRVLDDGEDNGKETKNSNDYSDVWHVTSSQCYMGG